MVCGEPVMERRAVRSKGRRMHVGCMERYGEGLDAAVEAYAAQLREALRPYAM